MVLNDEQVMQADIRRHIPYGQVGRAKNGQCPGRSGSLLAAYAATSWLNLHLSP
jgi:hypothetical protein